MVIRYTLEDQVFKSPTLDGLLRELDDFLESLGVKANARIEGGEVVAEYPDAADIDADEDMRIALGFCNSRRFGKAKKVLGEFLARKPYHSDAYRLLAQISMEEREFDKAVEKCTTALRLNPRNNYALVLLGNLYGRDKHDRESGLKFYRRALALDPQSYLAMVNCASLLVETEEGRDEAIGLYRRALELQPDYINPYYGLAALLDKKGEKAESFRILQQGLVLGRDRPENSLPIRESMKRDLVRFAAELSNACDAQSVVDELVENVAREEGVEIRVEEDDRSPYPAILELAAIHRRDYNILRINCKKFNGSRHYPAIHELLKHRIRVATGKAGLYVHFANHVNGSENFRAWTMPYVSDKLKEMVGDGLDGLLDQFMNGIGSQLMNCPLDYFATKMFFEDYPAFIPCLTEGAFHMLSAGIEAVSHGERIGLPKNVVRLNRVLNAVSFMQYRDLLGLDYLEALGLPSDDQKLAKGLYAKLTAAADKYYPGAEWEVVRIFLEELKCGRFFKLLGAENSLTDRLRKEAAVETFHKSVEENPAIGASVTAYMVEAIRRLRALPEAEVKKIAVEIAMLGMDGISPSREIGYSVPSLGGEDMSGCRMLAYYYVSWAMAIPEEVSSLGLPFAAEYEEAKVLASE